MNGGGLTSANDTNTNNSQTPTLSRTTSDEDDDDDDGEDNDDDDNVDDDAVSGHRCHLSLRFLPPASCLPGFAALCGAELPVWLCCAVRCCAACLSPSVARCGSLSGSHRFVGYVPCKFVRAVRLFVCLSVSVLACPSM